MTSDTCAVTSEISLKNGRNILTPCLKTKAILRQLQTCTLNVVSDMVPCIEAELLIDCRLHYVFEVKREHKHENTTFIYPHVTVKLSL